MSFKVLDKNNDMIKNQKNRLKENTKGITLIALVVTVIVLLILARSKYSDANWREPAFYDKLGKQKNRLKLQVKKNRFN